MMFYILNWQLFHILVELDPEEGHVLLDPSSGQFVFTLRQIKITLHWKFGENSESLFNSQKD